MVQPSDRAYSVTVSHARFAYPHGPTRAISDYIATYLERDLHGLTMVRDLTKFQTFLGLCAGRTGQLLSLEQLGNESGVSTLIHRTIRFCGVVSRLPTGQTGSPRAADPFTDPVGQMPVLMGFFYFRGITSLYKVQYTYIRWQLSRWWCFPPRRRTRRRSVAAEATPRGRRPRGTPRSSRHRSPVSSSQRTTAR